MAHNLHENSESNESNSYSNSLAERNYTLNRSNSRSTTPPGIITPPIGSPTLISSATDSTPSKFEPNFSQAHTSSTNDHETTDHSRNSLENAIQNIQISSEIQSFSFSTTVNVRTTVEVCNLRKETLPIDIPKGPWKTDVGAKTDLEIWASNFMTGGGKFALIANGSVSATTKCGRQRIFRCSRFRKYSPTGEKRNTISSKCDCPFSIRIEECFDGWTIRAGRFEHNHDLTTTVGSCLADASLRYIPKELQDLGLKLHRAGLSVSKISQTLQSEALYNNSPVTWTYQDIYNKFAPSPEYRCLDATNFITFLKQRNSEEDLYYNATTDSDGCLDKVFWVLKGALGLWIENEECNPIIYDTSHGTNKYGLKFAGFTSIDSNGQTVILACSLLTSETEDSFAWTFSEFLMVFKRPPIAIFTDGDGAMAAALRTVWPLTTHLLCTYHLQKNLYVHIKPLFTYSANKDVWRTFLKHWWGICKKQDIDSCSEFDTEWNELIDITDICRTSDNEKTFNDAKSWLQTLHSRRKQWAARWTWQIQTLGVHSTQRAEAIHSSIKRFLSANTLLTQLASKIDDSRNTLSDLGEGKSIRLALKNSSSTTGYHPIEHTLRQIITPFAFSIVKSQISQCVQYGIEDTYLDTKSKTIEPIEVYVVKYICETDAQPEFSNDSQDVSKNLIACDLGIQSNLNELHKYSRKTTLNSCTCLFPNCWGLPCRHMLRIYLEKKITCVPPEILSKIWIKKTDEEKADSFKSFIHISPLVHTTLATQPVLSRDDRYSLLCSEFKNLAFIASLTMEKTDEIRHMVENCRHSLLQKDMSVNTQKKEQLLIANPKHAKSKGRPVNKRKRGAGECLTINKKKRI